MAENPMSIELEEFYVIRVAHHEVSKQQEAFIAAGNKLLRANRALRFASIEAAENYLARFEKNPAYDYTIQFCIIEGREILDTPLQQLIARIMEIPQPYRRTAYNWVRGKDVRTILLRESQEVYDRHQQTLLEYDIDITRPSSIILFRPSGRFDINDVMKQDKDAPQQYFAYPGQKPKN